MLIINKLYMGFEDQIAVFVLYIAILRTALRIFVTLIDLPTVLYVL